MDYTKFKPMKPPSGTLNIDDVIYPCWASIKYDGFRCVVMSNRTWLNSLREVDNHHTRRCLESHSALLDGFDGELTVGDLTDPECFSNCQSAFTGRDAAPNFTFWVFDWVGDMPYEERMAKIREREPHLPHFVRIVEQKLINNREELDAYVEKVIEAKHEGVMLRRRASGYKFGRATFKTQEILRIKPLETGEARITGFEPEYFNGNVAAVDNHGNTKRSSSKENLVAKDTLGKLICECPKFGEIKLSGFTDAFADEVWQNKAKFLGALAHYSYQAHGTTDKPRIPKFKGIRSLKDM